MSEDVTHSNVCLLCGPLQTVIRRVMVRGNVLKKVVERYEVVCCVRRKFYLILKEIELRVDLEEYLDEIPNSLYTHD